jgi:four helix bundle protein
MSKQVFRSGTSIGANIHEAIQGQSRADFISKLNISLKEACVKLGFLTPERFDEVFHPEQMV